MEQLIFLSQLYVEIGLMFFVFFIGVMYVAGRLKAEGVINVTLGSLYLAAIWPWSLFEMQRIMRSMK
jgi:hypothetical protein